MKTIKIAAALLGLAISVSSWAHVGLTQAVPVKDAMLMQSPEEISLTFSGEVRLIRLSLSTESESPIEFGFEPNIDPQATYQWPLPTLASGKFGVRWIALGKDGHKMSGQYQFAVDSQDMKKVADKAQMSHSEHQH